MTANENRFEINASIIKDNFKCTCTTVVDQEAIQTVHACPSEILYNDSNNEEKKERKTAVNYTNRINRKKISLARMNNFSCFKRNHQHSYYYFYDYYCCVSLLFFSLPLLCLFRGVTSSSFTTAATANHNIMTPIKHWDPSWTASTVQGTCVAVSCKFMEEQKNDDASSDDESSTTKENNNNNCILLLTRSEVPNTVSSKLKYKPLTHVSKNTEEAWKKIDTHLRMLEIPSSILTRQNMPMVASYSSPSSSSFASSSGCVMLGRNVICSMTGLASDIDHVSRVVQQGIHTDQIIYDGEPSTITTAASAAAAARGSILQHVQSFATVVRDAARWKGGRPYGIQALVMSTTGVIGNGRGGNDGGDDKQKRTTTTTTTTTTRVYSIDPSGAWRSWTSGACAIGRNAEQIREQLVQELVQFQSSTTTTSSSSSGTENNKCLHPQQALQVALKALLRATQTARINQDLDQYEAVLMWIDTTETTTTTAKRMTHVATLHPYDVKSCRDELWNELGVDS